jgi:hypothetical protein
MAVIRISHSVVAEYCIVVCYMIQCKKEARNSVKYFDSVRRTVLYMDQSTLGELCLGEGIREAVAKSNRAGEILHCSS